MSNATLVLFGAYELLPAGTDVFAYLAASLHSSFYPSSIPDSFRIQTYVLMVVLGFEVLFFGAAYAIRAHKIKQWFPFRLLHTTRGVYIAPHFVLSCQFASAIFLLLLIPYAVAADRHAKGEKVSNYMLWLMLVWTSIFEAAMLAVWSIAVALATASAGKTSKLRWTGSAVTLNSLFLANIGLGSVAIIISSSLAQYRFNRLDDAYQVINAALLNFSSSLSSSTSDVVQAELTTLVTPLQLVFNRHVQLDTVWRTVWGLWSARSLTLFTAFVIIGPRYFIHIRRQMRESSNLYSRSRNSRSVGSYTVLHQSQQPRARLQRAWRDAVLGTVGILLGSLVYAGISLTLAVIGPARSNSPTLYSLFIFAGCWTAAVISLPTSTLALFRALSHSPLYPSLLGTQIAPDFDDAPRAPKQGVVGRPLERTQATSPPHAIRVEVQREIRIERERSVLDDDKTEHFEM